MNAKRKIMPEIGRCLEFIHERFLKQDQKELENDYAMALINENNAVTRLANSKRFDLVNLT